MQQHPEHQYLDLLRDVMENGYEKHEFNSGISFKSVFGRQIRFNLEEGFPLLTTKKVFFRGIVYELLWFLQGNSNIKYLVDNNVHIWDDWAFKKYTEGTKGSKGTQEPMELKEMTKDEFINKIKDDDDFAAKWGELGPVYGRQWRKWVASDGREIDQIAWVIEKLKKTPERRHALVSAWNPEFIYEMAAPGKSMALPPCHTMFQFNVINNKLSLQLYQRSADLFLGVPFNIASYALLLHMVAHVTGFKIGEFVHTFGDAHIYSNHYDQVKEQLTREPRPFPTLEVSPHVKRIDEFIFEDFKIDNYDPHPPIKGEVTVVGGF